MREPKPQRRKAVADGLRLVRDLSQAARHQNHLARIPAIDFTPMFSFRSALSGIRRQSQRFIVKIVNVGFAKLRFDAALALRFPLALRL